MLSLDELRAAGLPSAHPSDQAFHGRQAAMDGRGILAVGWDARRRASHQVSLGVVIKDMFLQCVLGDWAQCVGALRITMRPRANAFTCLACLGDASGCIRTEVYL